MGLIPDEIIAQVIDRTDIVETISTYIPLKRAGRNFKANCPFHHEKTPSFVINPDKQIFHCFGCGVGGNVINFVMKQDRLSFPEAVRVLAEKVNVVVPSFESTQSGNSGLRQQIFDVNKLAVEYFHKRLLSDKSDSSKNAREYLKNRNIDLETVQQFKIGLAADQWDGVIKYLGEKGTSLSLIEKAGLIIPRDNREGYYDRFRNRIMFPILDAQSNCRAFGGRALDDNPAKYINSPETSVYTKGRHLYGFHLAKTDVIEKDFVVIVEGYIDCIMPFQAGFKNIVASLGTALTVDQIRQLRRYTNNVVMLFDMDQAGESAVIRSLDILVEEDMTVKVAALAQGEDPDSFIRKYGVQQFGQRIAEAKSLFDYKLDILKGKFDSSSIEGKAKISSEMLFTINKFNNAVVRSEYVRRLAQELMIDEIALKTEIKKLEQNQSNKKTQDTPIQKFDMNQKIRAVEGSILRLLLEEEQFISITKQELEIDDFQDARVRNVISKIYELFDQGKSVSCSSLINSFEDQSMQLMISQIVASDEILLGDKEKIHRDCLNRIKKDRLKVVRQKIMVEMKQAEMSGDHNKLDELKEKFNQLIKR